MWSNCEIRIIVEIIFENLHLVLTVKVKLPGVKYLDVLRYSLTKLVDPKPQTSVVTGGGLPSTS